MEAKLIVVMGVSGSGKTTVAKLLADELGCAFYDADDFHTPENIKKMQNGSPLTDADRADWLHKLAGMLYDHEARAERIVLACSALKARYRHILRGASTALRFVYLKGDYGLICRRMAERQGHYMKPAMLQSQFDALEEPADALVLDIAQTLQILVKQIMDDMV